MTKHRPKEMQVSGTPAAGLVPTNAQLLALAPQAKGATHQTPKQAQVVEISLAAVWQHLDVDAFRDKRLFITGATGFFGFWLLAALGRVQQSGRALEVTVLSRNPARFLGDNPQWSGLSWLTFLQGNVRDFAFPAGEFDMVIHAAADTAATAFAEPLTLFDDIVIGSRRVLDFAVVSQAQRVLLVSSGAVYGPQPPTCSHILDDATFACPTHVPGNAYAEGKRVMELLGTLYRERTGLNTVVARCFAFVGPGLPLTGYFAIGNFIHDALFEETIHVKGTSTVVRSYLYGADLAIWLLQLLVHAPGGRSFNVGSDQAISILDLAHLVRDVIAPEKNITMGCSGQLADASRSVYVPDVSRARSELHLNAWTPLKTALTHSATFFQS